MPRPCKQKKQFWVYGHYTDNGELFYVGKGTMYRAFNMRERNYVHKGIQKKHGCHVGIVWGPTYDENEAYEKEELYVRELHTCVYDENRVKHAANLDWGGLGAATGIVRSKETGDKIRHARSEYWKIDEHHEHMSKIAKERYDNGHGELMRSNRKTGEEHFFYGKSWGRIGPLSNEAKRKISEKHKGKVLNDEHKQAITHGLNSYYEEHHGPNLGKVFTIEQRRNMSVGSHFQKKPVFGYNENDECVVCYFSAPDAHEATGLSWRTLNGDRKKYRKKYVDGITYKRSNMTIRQLKYENASLTCEGN